MKQYSSFTDAELLGYVKHRDTKAYAELYDRFWGILFRYAHKMLEDPEDAKDAVQDVFTMLWLKSAQLEIRISVSSFLYAAVRNNVLNRIDHSKVKQKYIAGFADFIDKGIYTTDEHMIAKELAGRFEKAMTELPEGMRKVFELSRIEELSYREIGEKLKVTDHTVKKQISNALKILRRKLTVLLTIF